MNIVIIMQCEANLFQVVATLCSSSGFSCLLNRWQQQCDKDGDDGNYYQQFDECKCLVTFVNQGQSARWESWEIVVV